MARNIDGVLVQWGDRLFYPGNRIVKPDPPPYLNRRAAVIRGRISALVRRAPQVIVKISGGGKGMVAIAAHMRYITQRGRLGFEDDRGTIREGREALRDLVDQWRYSGRFIADVETRREALNLVLALRAGTDADLLKEAARDFARIEFAGYRYVMVLHKHQASPHVHLCVKHESIAGERLSHGMGDIKRWRETFADRLQAWGVDASATRSEVRGATRHFDPVWRLKANDDGRMRVRSPDTKNGRSFQKRCADAMSSWANILAALQDSERDDDRRLAVQVGEFLRDTPFIKALLRDRPELMPETSRARANREPKRTLEIQPRVRPDVEWER
ncbi:hypothetical protein ASC95_08760 [Pelomonas sp. Root1217]|uniref:relaxase/mobilization nuclease domain-containing protein n=1 Tax=Pelomonas sp. Root1217 TaxID=1736430 RepID=UPI00070BF12F|nr:hypothetical protein [Pelomonas sp. Root1217]KQV52878.1 hypothetical protein ASC95_08760 [Pelomonas sp. Root1217]